MVRMRSGVASALLIGTFLWGCSGSGEMSEADKKAFKPAPPTIGQVKAQREGMAKSEMELAAKHRSGMSIEPGK
jgi:hypothetical protein